MGHEVPSKDNANPVGEMPRRVLVADDEHLVAASVCEDLRRLGIEVVGPASNGEQAEKLAAEEQIDLALLDIKMPGKSGLEVAAVFHEEHGIPVVILSAYADPAYIEEGARAGVFGYLLKPTSTNEIQACLTVAWSRYHGQTHLEEEVEDLKQALEDRKLIERSKGVLMDRLKLSEAEAMRKLQKQARDTRRKLPDVARSILENEDLFRETK